MMVPPHYSSHYLCLLLVLTIAVSSVAFSTHHASVQQPSRSPVTFAAAPSDQNDGDLTGINIVQSYKEEDEQEVCSRRAFFVSATAAAGAALAVSAVLVDAEPAVADEDIATAASLSSDVLLADSASATSTTSPAAKIDVEATIQKSTKRDLGGGKAGASAAVVQALSGITVNVADQSQQSAMINFLQDSFDFKVLRKSQSGSITQTWLGFGPEQLSVPEDFVPGASSFAEYGGHASICVRYDAKSTDVLYRKGENAPGENIAFLQVGVPGYRISQMVKNDGNVLDAYGFVNVVSPCGLPMRGIVGIWPDPIMFVAINTPDIQQSRAFYQQLGFIEQEYPYARPSKGAGQFEPAQPPKSVYLAPSVNSMGVLLLPAKSKKTKITPNPVFRSLNVVYTPSEGSENADDLQLEDPQNVGISFVSTGKFEKVLASTIFAAPTSKQ